MRKAWYEIANGKGQWTKNRAHNLRKDLKKVHNFKQKGKVDFRHKLGLHLDKFFSIPSGLRVQSFRSEVNILFLITFQHH